jgi:muramoyltetrapeptide carboxypeptidase
LGAFTACSAASPNDSLTLLEIFSEILLPNRKPAVYNFRCGHCLPTATLPLGAPAILTADDAASILMQ